MFVYIDFGKSHDQIMKSCLACIQYHVYQEHQTRTHVFNESQAQYQAQDCQKRIIVKENLVCYWEYFFDSVLVRHYNQQYQDIISRSLLPLILIIIKYLTLMHEESKTYEKLMKIGEGAYGAVYKARNLHTNQIVALKVTRFDVDDEGVPSTTLREISILKSLEHQNIVRLMDINHGMDKEQFVIQLVFQFMDEDLGKFIRRRKDVSEGECRLIFKKIVEGVKYLHDHKVYHRDLKPQNILINQKLDVKIADFGLSRVIVNPKRTFSKQIQTLWYRSPELLLGAKHYGMGVDIWSLGCILYELVQGKVLFKGDSQISQIFLIFQTLGTPKLTSWPEAVNLPHFKKSFPKLYGKQIALNKLSSQGANLLTKMIEINPEKRINISGILNHPYFRGV